jgi:outer membrane protein assembly factor BamB/tRNA A-37 threonylcarbamoyl transferase component Bud32
LSNRYSYRFLNTICLTTGYTDTEFLFAFQYIDVYNQFHIKSLFNKEGELETKRITSSLDTQTSKTVKQLDGGVILFNRYQIQDVIGIGGMGSVYRARDLHFPNVIKLVAVKEMINNAPDPLVRQTVIQNFEREANILVTLNHIAIPQIFDFFSIDERSYLVLEYVHGKDLESLLAENNGPVHEDNVIAWAIELCDVLDYLHSYKPEPIIFRDMKPSNVMINQQGRVVLVDFGIAKNFKTGQKGTMIGTEGYSPPEQYRGDATPVADVYALGATLHHLLTDRDPRVEAPFSFGERHIRTINPRVSIDLELVINTALQYNAEERFKNVVDFKNALLSVAKKTGALSRLPISKKSENQSVKPLWTFKCEDEIRGSVTYDNGKIYVGCYDNNLYVLDASDGSFQWKFPTSGGIVGKPVIFDNNVFFGSEDKKIYSVSTRTGKELWSFQTDGPIRNSLKIAEGHIFFGSDDGYLYAVNLISNNMTWRIDSGAPIRTTPFITRDNVFFGNEYGDFFCVDFSGHIKWRFKTKKAITSSPIVSENMVFFASHDSTFYALDAKSGWVIWRFRMGKGSISSPCRVNDSIIFGSADNHIYCLEMSNAKEIWRYKTDHQVSGSPIVNNNSVYCGSADGTLYCLEIKNGQERWKFKTDDMITGTPTIANDIFYIGSCDHIIYALYA